MEWNLPWNLRIPRLSVTCPLTVPRPYIPYLYLYLCGSNLSRRSCELTLHGTWHCGVFCGLGVFDLQSWETEE